MSSFPIDDRHLIAADDFRHVLLQQSQIQSTFPNSPIVVTSFGYVLSFGFFPLNRTRQETNMNRDVEQPVALVKKNL
jgi:hypothetical protein